MPKSLTIRTFLLAALSGVFAMTFALSPQINLWKIDADGTNGIYATHDMDEAGYAAYVQSLIDGKTRLNSPYTAAEDSAETPLKESLFSIQFLASYPIAIVAKIFGLSSSGAFVLASAFFGFTAGLAVFWLFLLLFKDPFVAFTGALSVLAAGALAGGQGNLIRSYAPERIYYGIAFPFARRVVPLVGFPALFLFFGGVWIILQNEDVKKRVFYTIGTVLAFVVLVYSYFYLWTTAFAWLAGVGLLLILLRPENYRKHLTSLSLLAGMMVVVLIPYFLLIANRSETTDSVQLLQYTRMPDLDRAPELISIFVGVVFFLLAIAGRMDLKDIRNLFLLSFALAGPIVFNQQVVTGRSLQPIHYQFFAINYTAMFALLSLIFVLVSYRPSKYLNKFLLMVSLIGFHIGYVEIRDQRSIDVLRDDIVPVANMIKNNSVDESELVLSFDLVPGVLLPISDEMPALASRPVMWALHQRVFSDVSSDENLERFFYFLYLQNLDENWLRKELIKKTSLVVHGVFGWGRGDHEVLAGKNPITEQEIEQYVALYRAFILDFDQTKARKYPVSFVVAHEIAKDSFANFDRHYEREFISKFKKYLLFKSKLRP